MRGVFVCKLTCLDPGRALDRHVAVANAKVLTPRST